MLIDRWENKISTKLKLLTVMLMNHNKNTSK